MPQPPTSLAARPGQNLRFDTDHLHIEMMEKAIRHLNRAQVNIRIEDNCVVLSGEADTWHCKQQVQESLRRLAGGRVILNRLNVSNQAW
ncbi:MAG: BON domain-containing protein [Planctomycetaceae bacterium]|nr:BON domain-containing protein [Planctomycetaceae bacterium]